MRSSNINPKEKGKKESTFRGAGFCGCKLFDLKIFLLKYFKDEGHLDKGQKTIHIDIEEKFYAKPGGLELAGTKDKTLLWLDFFYLILFKNIIRL